MPRKTDPERQAAAMLDQIAYQGRPCKRGHPGRRYTSTGACVDCVRERDAARQKAR